MMGEKKALEKLGWGRKCLYQNVISIVHVKKEEGGTWNFFVRVFELCNDSLKKESEYSERGKMVQTIRKTRKLMVIATVKAESPATASWTGFVFPGDPA